jgi:formimidoylglutamate deiminase
MSALWFEQALLQRGWAPSVRIGIAGQHIATIEPDTPAAPGDERFAIGLPGVPNLHSHAFQRGMAGLAERRGPAADNFWTWREAMYRFLGALDPDDVEAIAALAYSEMLEAGFTTAGEFHYLHHDTSGTAYANPAELAERIVSAAAATGIGLTLLPVFYAHGGFGGAVPTDGQRRFISTLDGYALLLDASRRAAAHLPHSIVGVAPHSLRAVTPDQLTALVTHAATGPIHMHIAEQTAEVDACRAWSGQRPVEWLLAHHAVDARWCLIHATHMTPDETAAVAKSGAVAGLCPVTEANLGDGIFNGAAYSALAGRFGVGTDSNVLIGLADELRQLEYSQRLHERQRSVMATAPGQSTGRALFDEALAGGARALGIATPGLAPGARAGIVALDRTHPALTHATGDTLLDAWIFATAHGAVDTVWSLGRKVVSGGRHIHRDTIRARYAHTLSKVLQA